MNHFGNVDEISVSISPNGKLIAIDSYDIERNTPATTLWDIATSKPIGQSLQDASLSTFSPDSKLLITANQNDETITLWDLSDLAHLKPIGEPIPGYLATFSPDGKRLIIGGDPEGSTLRLWDLDANKLINDSIPGFYATFSLDGKLLAVLGGESEEQVAVWDLATFKKIGGPIPGGFMAFSPDGNSLAIGNSENSIVIWDLATRKPIGDPIPGYFPVRFSRDGKILVATGEFFDTIALWELNTQKQIGDTISGSSGGNNVPVLPYAGSSSDDKIFAFYDNENNAYLWNVETHTKLNVPNYPGEILGINLNQNGPFFVQNTLSSAPDSNILAIYGTHGLRLWDLNKDKQLGNTMPLGSQISATNVIISPSGKVVASFAEDGIVLRDMVTNADIHLEYSGQLTGNMIFSADSARLITLDADNTLISWNVTTGESIIFNEQPLIGLSVVGALFSPDGKYLAYESNNNNDYSLYVWDIVAGKPYIEDPIQLKNSSGTITFSPDGTLVIYNDGAKIVLYNLQTKEQAGEMLTDLNGVSDLSMITEGDELKYIISVDSSGTTQIWDWTTRTKIGDPISGSLQIIGINSQDHTVIYIDSSGRLIKWKWDLGHAEWRELLCPLAKRNFTQEEWKLYFPDVVEYPRTKELLTCPEYPAGK